MSSTIASVSTIEIFVSFAHEDSILRDELEKHLNILKRQGQIRSWYNREIQISKEWTHEIDVGINAAQIILLLVSPDFMNSDYCFGAEMKRALERHEAGEANIIPIILRPVYWENAPFSRLQVLPTNGEPVTRWSDRDEAFLDIAIGIQGVVKELLASYKNAEGDAQYKNEQYKEALNAYDQAIQLNPRCAPAYNGKGNVLHDLKRDEEALNAYDQAIQLNPRCAPAYNGKGNVLHDLKRDEEALNAYDQAIQLKPNDAYPYYNKGNTLYHLKRYEEALAAYDQAIFLDSNYALAYNGKGNALYHLKRYEEALAAYDQAIFLDSNYALAYNGKGNALYHLKRYKEALAAYDQAVLLDPNYAPAYNGKGAILYDLKQYEEALIVYERAILLDPYDASAHNNMGIILYCLKRYEEAVSVYDQVIFLDSGNALAYYNKGTALYHLKRYKEAASIYEQAIFLGPDDASAHNNMGSVLYHLKRYEKALAAYEQAILLDPNYAPTYNDKGNVLCTLGHYEAALLAYQQAIHLNVRFALAYNGKGTALYHLKRYEEALAAYERAIRLNPKDDSAYCNKGNTFLALKRHKEALVAYEQAILLNPKSTLAYSGKGIALYHHKRYEEALTACEQAIFLDPNYAPAYNDKGNVLYQLKRYKPALAAYEQAISLDPDNVLAFFNKGTALYHLRRYKPALAAYEQAISLDPDYAVSFNGKGNVLCALKRYKEALLAYEEAIQLNARFALAYNGKGTALYHLKRYEEALAAYEQAIFLDPNYAPAYNDRGNVLRSLERYEMAWLAYEQAIRLNPDDALAYCNVGNVLYDLKRYEKALAAYEQAIQLNPKNAVAYTGKGNALHKLRIDEEALVAYEQAILLDPKNALAYNGRASALYDLKLYEEALVVYEQAIRLDPNMEVRETTDGPQSLLVRIKLVEQFLIKNGFDIESVANQPGFIAVPRTPMWRERFPRRLYVRVLFDTFLDQHTVQSIYQNVKSFSDHALIVIDRQPEISGWMAMGGLRVEEKDRFVFLQIAESLIKESIVLNKEAQTFNFYINKQLGQDFDPYDIRDPVSDAVNFFGRESLTDEILNALKLGQRLGLFGLHKMGKSSVLYRLKKKAEFPVAYVYLATGDSLFGIYRRILEGWFIDIRMKHPVLQWAIPQLLENSDIKTVFDAATKDLLVQLGRVTDTPMLGIFLDEIEHIIPYKQGDESTLRFYVNLMDSLRGLQQETSSLSLLVAGVHPNIARRNYFWSDQKNPMYQVIGERFLLPLDKEDCAYMIRSLGQQINMTYDNDALEYIIQMSGAHPFLARQICSYAYKNRRDTDTVSVQSIQGVVHDYIRDPAMASYFDDYGLWGELCKQDIWGEDISYTIREILSLLATSPGELAESEIYSSLNRKLAERALAALQERGIISALGGSNYYDFTFGLFRDWIRLHKLGLE
jgi:tetratricopeptide (TPR) repeat protein